MPLQQPRAESSQVVARMRRGAVAEGVHTRSIEHVTPVTVHLHARMCHVRVLRQGAILRVPHAADMHLLRPIGAGHMYAADMHPFGAAQTCFVTHVLRGRLHRTPPESELSALVSSPPPVSSSSPLYQSPLGAAFFDSHGQHCSPALAPSSPSSPQSSAWPEVTSLLGT